MTTHFTTHFCRPIGVLAGLALLASLLVAVPGPIKAADPAPDYLATFEACPEDVIPSADFSDVSARHDNADDIDCIAYYGITNGTTPTTYSPDAPVIREHMALFLTRLARLVGIDLPPPGSSTPFTDVAHLSQESKDAISQIYQLRITIGTSTTTYTPQRNVKRGEMALFLQRLMDEMDPVVDGRDDYGYRPEDVANEVIEDADVESPFRDLQGVTREVDQAIAQLYELGVASGTSESTYGLEVDMSRTAMAEFMAAILDHSNLRPEGMTVQVSPASGLDDYDITAMITVRDPLFRPVDNRVVDYFYTADADADAGLQQNGECDEDFILDDGDCVWDEDDDEETDRDGNIFVEFTAEPGENMTFYAWVGRRDGDEFDADSVDYNTAMSRSSMGPDRLQITSDIPANAAQIDDQAWIVDLDRQDSVEFTIRLLGEDGNVLALEGVEIGVDILSDEIVVNAASVVGGKPAPTYQSVGGDDEDEVSLVTDEDGEATFELEGPRRDERLDTVTIFADCCDDEVVTVAWSDGEAVLVDARPDFDPYVQRSGSGSTSVRVEYHLYDQYGNELRGVTESRTGRTGIFQATLKYDLYTGDGSPDSEAVGADDKKAHSVTPTRGRITETLQANNAPTAGSYFVLTPQIFSDKDPPSNGEGLVIDTDDIAYAVEPIVVWIVERAVSNPTALLDSNRRIMACDFMINSVLGMEPEPVEVFPREDKFRTCFTLWSYRQGDRFLKDNDTLTVAEFETELEELTEANKIEIVIYSTRSTGRRIFKID